MTPLQQDVERVRAYAAQCLGNRAADYSLHICRSTLDEALADGLVDWSTGVAVIGGATVVVNGKTVPAGRESQP
jgi:hypothetical protein